MYDLERLLDAIRKQESDGDQNAVSPAGARTAYGIMPDTARDPGFGVPPSNIDFLAGDEGASREFSRNYMKAMIRRYGGNVDKALKAYNGGPGRVSRGGPLPQETRNYAPAVMAHYNAADGQAKPMGLAGAQPEVEKPKFAFPQEGGDTGAPIQDDAVGSMYNEPSAPMPPPNTGGASPIKDPGVSGMFLGGQGTGVQLPQPGAPQKLAPGSDDAYDAAEEGPPEDDVPPQRKRFLERMADAGVGPAMMRFGAGLAAGSTKGWGAGIGAGLAGAADAFDTEGDRRDKFMQLYSQNAYRSRMLEQGDERNAIARSNSKTIAANNKRVAEIYVDGKPQKVMLTGNTRPDGTPEYQPLGGQKSQQQQITGVDKEQILKSDEVVSTGRGAISSLNYAKQLSKDAYTGPTAGMRGYATSLFGNEAGEKTELLHNVVMGQALGQLKVIFGGNPTEGERAILTELQGSTHQAAKVREEIYDRAIKLAEKRIKLNAEIAKSIREGTYYTPEGTPDATLDDGGLGAPPAPPTQEELNLMDDEDKVLFQ